MKDLRNILRVVLFYGLIGGLGTGLVGGAFGSWMGLRRFMPLGPASHDAPAIIQQILLGTAVGFLGAFLPGFLMGLIAGSLGRPVDWLFSGMVVGWFLCPLAAPLLDSRKFGDYITYSPGPLSPFGLALALLSLPVVGLIIGSAIHKGNPALPYFNQARKIIGTSALDMWPSWGRTLLAVSWPVLSYVFLLAFITWPVFWQNKHYVARHGFSPTWQRSYLVATSSRYGRRTSCQSNLKQIALAMKQYVQDNDEKFPLVAVAPTAPYGWADAIQPYSRSTQLLQCPNEFFVETTEPQKRGYTDYWFNSNMAGANESLLPFISNTILLGDGNDDTDLTDARYNKAALPAAWLNPSHAPAQRHLGGLNFAFADGHVKWYKPNLVTTAPATATRATFAIR